MQEFFDFNYWKVFFNSSTKKRLAENFFSLSILQIASYLPSLITLPYLVRVLGPEKFGLVAFSQAFIGYFSILTSYGFNLSATREVSINRDNKEKITEIFSSVMIAKIILCMLSLLILGIFLIFIPKFNNDWLIYLITFGVILGDAIFPVWFFQGMERMKYIASLNVVASVIFPACVFIFIKSSEDFFYVPLINSFESLIIGIISILVVYKDFGIKLVIPKTEKIIYQFKEGWHTFISTLSISLYTTSNSFIIGLFTNNVTVGYYSAAEKIVKAVVGLISPFFQTVYPFFSKKFTDNKIRATEIFKKLLFVSAPIFLSISIILSLFSPLIVKILLGDDYTSSILILRILVFIIFAVGISNILGVQGLLTNGYKKEFFKIVFLCGLLHLALAISLLFLIGIVGVAIATVITEILIACYQYYTLKKLKIL